MEDVDTHKVVFLHCFQRIDYETMSVSNFLYQPDNVTVGFLDYSRDWDLFLLNITNETDSLPTEEPRDLWREIPLGIVLTLLCLVTSVGNAMVLHAVRTERRLQTVRTLVLYIN